MSRTAVAIRRLRWADWPELARLSRTEFPHVCARETSRVLRDADHLLIADICGSAVGYCHFYHRAPGTCWINYLAVVPSWRGNGCARRLIEAVSTRAARLGCGTLQLSVRHADWRAARFYEHLGFVVMRSSLHTPVYEKTISASVPPQPVIRPRPRRGLRWGLDKLVYGLSVRLPPRHPAGDAPAMRGR